MRLDKHICDNNPFLDFAKAKELTVLLTDDSFTFVATIDSISMVASFKSSPKLTGDNYLSSYTIPLDLILPLFKLDTKEKENILTLNTFDDTATISYNGMSVTTNIFSPNGLTLQQLSVVTSTIKTQELLSAPFIRISDIFGSFPGGVCNVSGSVLYISDHSKCVIHKGEYDFKREFSVPLNFIRMMKNLKAEKMYIDKNIVARTPSGLLLVTSLNKNTDNNSLLDYKFAVKISSEEIYTLRLNKYLKHLSLAVQSASIDSSLNLDSRKLTLTSNQNEKVVIELTEEEIKRNKEIDFFANMENPKEDIIINDSRLLKSLSTFTTVQVKVCPNFLIASLGKTHKLMFSLGGN